MCLAGFDYPGRQSTRSGTSPAHAADTSPARSSPGAGLPFHSQTGARQMSTMTTETQTEIASRSATESMGLESHVERMQSALVEIARLGDNAPDVTLGRRLGRIASDALAATAHASHDGT